MKKSVKSRLSEQCRRRREWIASELQIGARLKALREARGISQTELARLAGLPLSTIQNLEQDRASPRYDLVVAAYRALGISVEMTQQSGNGSSGAVVCPWCKHAQKGKVHVGLEQACQECRRAFVVEPVSTLPVLMPCGICGRRVAVKDGACEEHFGYGEGAFRRCEGSGQTTGADRRRGWEAKQPPSAASSPCSSPSPPGPVSPRPAPPG